MRGFARFLRGNAIGLLALFIVLGGTAYAATALPKNSVGSKQVKNGSLQKIDLSKKAQKALKGNRGLPGLTGAKGPTGATGPQGLPGAAGTARAYAEVDDSTPSFVVARTKNFTVVTRSGTGMYCLTAPGIDARTVASVAAVDYGISSVPGVAEVRGSGLSCTATQFEVETFNLSGTLVNTISFHLIVP